MSHATHWQASTCGEKEREDAFLQKETNQYKSG